MRQILFAVALVAVLAQATGPFTDRACGGRCSDACPDDDSEGQCPSDCASCACCAHAQPVVAASSAVVLRVPPLPLPLHERSSTPTAVDHRDIFHVPKSLLG